MSCCWCRSCSQVSNYLSPELKCNILLTSILSTGPLLCNYCSSNVHNALALTTITDICIACLQHGQEMICSNNRNRRWLTRVLPSSLSAPSRPQRGDTHKSRMEVKPTFKGHVSAVHWTAARLHTHQTNIQDEWQVGPFMQKWLYYSIQLYSEEKDKKKIQAL